MTNRPQYYISTPIYYVNDAPHIGHCYSTLVADVAARFQRLAGKDVFFLTGTDEHADRVATTAAERGLTPIEWATENAEAFKSAFEALNFTNSDFLRTTEPRHTEKVTQYIAALEASGDIYLGDYVGWYDVSQDEYVTETTAREAEYKSPVTGKPLEKRTEKNYFFRLSKFEQPLLDLIEANPNFILPSARRNEVVGRLKQGLQDVPVSRAIDPETPYADWGIKMPADPSHRVYIWIDALLNYRTGIDTPDRTKYWPADVHVIGKDILWFHAVIWPAMLMALNLDLPKCIYAHSWWIREGRKMSKSLGNFIDFPTIQAYADAYSQDTLKYFLITNGPASGTDADFAHTKFVEVANADLANGIGNAVSRVTNMIVKYFDGKCPDPKGITEYEGYDWPAIIAKQRTLLEEALEKFDLPGALRAALQISNEVDAYIHHTAPFKLAKDEANMPTVAAILYHCAEALRISATLLSPAIPEKACDILGRLGITDPLPTSIDAICEWGGSGGVRAGSPITKGDALFPRIDADAEPPASAVGTGAEA
jgi:methionyl-tRNA synthetase